MRASPVSIPARVRLRVPHRERGAAPFVSVIRGLLVRSAPGETGTAQPADAGGERSGPTLTVWYTQSDVGGSAQR